MEKNKYLGALYTIAFNTQIIGMNFGDELRTIKEAIIKLQELEEENNFLSNTMTTVNKQYTSLMSNYQEQKKVLEIILKKDVDIVYLKESNNVEEYNSHFGAVVCKLTPEEYDAVKELIK